ncbi:acyl-CoA dehydrogenase family protein [[Mycobacterium] nativiensis]|uniref:Acyl-CoA dehydrogenase family protein n=1 Tax=[Mycobacterium] nativiensis TaxID=2855503 RepID=A0ABU5XWT5_9MYCO|nr:acyl-CoA dehydrogenase family protein [Mycolicibacter sp. MYC340]MEB3031926.1 acyl-CoA dehydrogenase family protein [Mycolicibacter sp. MYC340]
MAADFTDLHDDLRAVAADVLARGSAVDWATLVDAGWVGLEVPDGLGGSGATFAEVAVICEELGRAAASTSYLGGAVLAVGVLNTVADSAVRDPLLAGIADGTIRAAAVLGDFTVSSGGLLTGHADFVPDAAGADRLLVAATDAAGGNVVVVADELTVTAQPLLDETRSVATVTADGIEVSESAVLHANAMAALRNRAALAVACDSLGLAEAMLAATVDYAKTRTQFGRPIGSFQAVKHACADMQVKNSVARALIREAVNSSEADLAAAVAMAKSYTCGAAVDVVGKALQLHGGIGYTWESGIHVYLKRATFNRSLFGSPAAHRQHLAQRYRTSKAK